ncbi:MAG: hypothetical protein ACYTEP_00100 [Planctomycetota bacterium]
MKPFLLLLLLTMAAILCGASLYSQSGSDPKPFCPDKGVVQLGGAWVESGFVACENGLLEFGWGSAKITWEDPVCPLMLTWIPPYHEVVDQDSSFVTLKSSANARAVFFTCTSDNCVVASHMHLDGDYDSYEVEGCQGGDPR